jgi:ubiquinone biosynthesis protein COQ9
MRFEKWKAEWRGSGERGFSLSRFLGRLRYPPR